MLPGHHNRYSEHVGVKLNAKIKINIFYQLHTDLIPYGAVAESVRMADILVSDSLIQKLLEPIRNNDTSLDSTL